MCDQVTRLERTNSILRQLLLGLLIGTLGLCLGGGYWAADQVRTARQERSRAERVLAEVHHLIEAYPTALIVPDEQTLPEVVSRP